jgi:hypothetical protein
MFNDPPPIDSLAIKRSSIEQFPILREPSAEAFLKLGSVRIGTKKLTIEN